MAVKMILTAPYGTHKYRKASSRRKRQPSDFTYMIYFVRMKVRNVPFPRILSPTENPVLLTYILWHILRIGSIPSDKKENDNRYKTKIIKEKEMISTTTSFPFCSLNTLSNIERSHIARYQKFAKGVRYQYLIS